MSTSSVFFSLLNREWSEIDSVLFQFGGELKAKIYQYIEIKSYYSYGNEYIDKLHMNSDNCQIEMMDGTSGKTSEFENKSSKYAIYFCSQHIHYRAHQEIKNQNRDSYTWIFIGNWILNLICFLQFFDLSTLSAAKMRFYFLHFLQGKNAQNRPKNQQNWNLAKIGLKSDNFMI